MKAKIVIPVVLVAIVGLILLNKKASASSKHVYITFADYLGNEAEMDATALLATPSYIAAGITSIQQFIDFWVRSGYTYVSQRTA